MLWVLRTDLSRVARVHGFQCGNNGDGIYEAPGLSLTKSAGVIVSLNYCV